MLFIQREGRIMAGKTKYKNEWQKNNVDRINLTVPKGKKERIRAYAQSRGESINGFINRLIDEDMERDKAPKNDT